MELFFFYGGIFSFLNEWEAPSKKKKKFICCKNLCRFQLGLKPKKKKKKKKNKQNNNNNFFYDDFFNLFIYFKFIVSFFLNLLNNHDINLHEGVWIQSHGIDHLFPK